MADKEGRRVKTLCPMNYVSPFLMKTREDSSNFYADRVEVSKAEQYIRQKKEKGLSEFNFMYVVLAAYVRTVAAHPQINRFIRGQRIYARNCIEIMLTVKNELKVNAPETVVKVIFPPDATAEEVYEILNKAIHDAKSGDNEAFDGLVRNLMKMPRPILRGVVNLLTFMDYYGWLPRSLTKVSPFHGSMAITSMGSLRIQPIYHHLYNFGNIPVFCAFGNRYLRHTVTSTGEVRTMKYIDLKFVLDERITDGYGYAAVFHTLKRILQDPFCLDERPEKIMQDID